MRLAIIDYEFDKLDNNVKFISLFPNSNVFNSNNYLGHGETCLKIINSLTDTTIFCLEIPLQSEYSIDCFCIAIQWCIDNNINLINISIGTPNFKNFYKINESCKRAFNAGIIMIAAISNNNIFTYPACLPYVIGVKYHSILPPSKYIFSWYPLNGIDILINSNIPFSFKDDKKIENFTSNSYATAYTTSIIANIMLKSNINSYTKVKKELELLSLLKKGTFNRMYEQFIFDHNNLPSDENITKIITTQLKIINNISKITVPLIVISLKDSNGMILLNQIKKIFIENGYNILLIASNKYLKYDHTMSLDCVDYVYPDTINKLNYYYTIQRIRNADILLICDENLHTYDLHFELGDNIFDISSECTFVGNTTEQFYDYIRSWF